MKFSFTKNPNNLKCPICNERVKFELLTKITCASCKSKLDLYKKSSQLQIIGWAMFCSPAIFTFLPDMSEAFLWIGTISFWVFAFVFIGMGNAEAKLVERR